MQTFKEFDPLLAKQTINDSAALSAVKREIRNILESYLGWFDPFCELIQNALDSLDDRRAEGAADYKPKIRITIDLVNNQLIVSDNGTGLSQEKYEKFLAPSLSFKSGKTTRGHKGVGATYLAYGFNYIQIATRTNEFSAIGKMTDARKWLDEENPVGNPKVHPDKDGASDPGFAAFDRGVSVCVRFDPTTRPGDLNWLRATTAKQWLTILSIKTGLGAFFPNSDVDVEIRVHHSKGKWDTIEQSGIEYHWPHTLVRKSQRLRDVRVKADELYAKQGKDFRLPGGMTNLDALHDSFNGTELKALLDLDEHEQQILDKYSPVFYFCYVYTAKFWPQYNEQLSIRAGQQVLTDGIQIAANNMPQGEMYAIPLRRYSGRQHQAHCLVHFDNCKADLGRKGFQKELVDFCGSVAKQLIEKPFERFRYTLRPITGVVDNLGREAAVDDWKDEMAKHEAEHPVQLISEHFFLPTKRISVTSTPTREQDVIALFNQLIAGGVIRGIRIMSTNERFTYDGMFRIAIEPPSEVHVFDEEKNPLGILPEYLKERPQFTSKPKILEYKFGLDGLIENLEDGDKNSNEISLVVVWETGEDYSQYFNIISLLDTDNLSYRQYHGVTHAMMNPSSGQREMDLIVLSELIDHLNDPNKSIAAQKAKYEQ